MDTHISRKRCQRPRGALFSPEALGNGEQNRPSQSPRFARATLSFWLGAVVLGTGGCILGGRMPYEHPVGVVISMLWWGIYLGCLGGSVSAVVALLSERV